MSDVMALLGREADLRRLWSTLRERSVLMTGPRRVGKTELMKHMVAHPEPSWTGVRVDLQGLGTTTAAAERTVKHLARAGLGVSGAARAAERVEEVSLGPVGAKRRAEDQDPWDELGEALARAVAQLKGRGAEMLLVCFDEVPWWLDEVKESQGADEARRALATLRYLRQRDDLADHVRFLFTGSVGLARAAHDLGATADINDLIPPFQLAPLSPVAAATLFETEVTARGRLSSPEGAALAVAVTAGFPHWMKVVADHAAFAVDEGEAVDRGAVERAREELLGPRMGHLFAHEGWEHLVRRHGRGAARASAGVLDVAASADIVPYEALVAAALTAGVGNRAAARDLIEALVDSWHLDVVEGGYRVLLPLFRAWWQRHGGAR